MSTPQRCLCLILAAILALTGLAGCGSDDKPKAAPPASPSPSQPPGLDTTEPERPPEANTKQSAVEYGQYFAQLVQYSVRIRSARPVQAEAFDQAKCTVCRKLDEFIQQLKKDEVWVLGPDLELGPFRTVSRPDGFTVSGPFAYPDGEFVTIEGKKDGDAIGGPYRFSADLLWDEDGSRWRVIDYTFAPKKDR